MDKKNKSQIEILSQPQEFFFLLIQESISSNKIYLSDEVQMYVVDVLSRFVHSDQLFVLTSNGSYKEEPLAFMLKEAEDELTLDPKRLLFRKIGDIALFTVGMFPDKKISDSYYQFMGKTAYNQAASLYKSNLKSLYMDLSINFEQISLVLRKINGIRI